MFCVGKKRKKKKKRVRFPLQFGFKKFIGSWSLGDALDIKM